MKRNRVVITGALGHIGSALLRQLPAVFPNAEFVAIDNLLSQRHCSLFNLPYEDRVAFLEADVAETDLRGAVAGARAVIHLAAITDAASSVRLRDEVERVNIKGTQKVAEACLAEGCEVFFPSTTSVYGPQGEIVDEDCPEAELRPQSPYADSKLRGEEYLRERAAKDGLRVSVCRFGTIFGTSPGMRFHTAVNKFCWQAAVGVPLTVWRTALHQMRPYLDIVDAVAAIRFVLERDLFDGRTYNVVSTNTTVSDILGMIARHIPDLQVQYVDTEIMNQLSYTVSNKRFTRLGFGWRGNLERGIAETLQLFRGLVRATPDGHR